MSYAKLVRFLMLGMHPVLCESALPMFWLSSSRKTASLTMRKMECADGSEKQNRNHKRAFLGWRYRCYVIGRKPHGSQPRPCQPRLPTCLLPHCPAKKRTLHLYLETASALKPFAIRSPAVFALCFLSAVWFREKQSLQQPLKCQFNTNQHISEALEGATPQLRQNTKKEQPLRILGAATGPHVFIHASRSS